MALEGKGRFLKSEASRNLIYVPADLAKDSAFPFKPGQELRVKIDKQRGRLIVEST